MPINTVTVWLPRKFKKNKKMNIENWIPIIYEPKTNTKKKEKKKKEKKAKWSNFDSIEPNIAKWLCYIYQIQKKKTVKNKKLWIPQLS